MGQHISFIFNPVNITSANLQDWTVPDTSYCDVTCDNFIDEMNEIANDRNKYESLIYKNGQTIMHSLVENVQNPQNPQNYTYPLADTSKIPTVLQETKNYFLNTVKNPKTQKTLLTIYRSTIDQHLYVPYCEGPHHDEYKQKSKDSLFSRFENKCSDGFHDEENFGWLPVTQTDSFFDRIKDSDWLMDHANWDRATFIGCQLARQWTSPLSIKTLRPNLTENSGFYEESDLVSKTVANYRLQGEFGFSVSPGIRFLSSLNGTKSAHLADSDDLKFDYRRFSINTIHYSKLWMEGDYYHQAKTYLFIFTFCVLMNISWYIYLVFFKENQTNIRNSVTNFSNRITSNPISTFKLSTLTSRSSSVNQKQRYTYMYSVFYNYIFVVCTLIPIVWAVAKFWNGWNPYQIPVNASGFTCTFYYICTRSLPQMMPWIAILLMVEKMLHIRFALKFTTHPRSMLVMKWALLGIFLTIVFCLYMLPAIINHSETIRCIPTERPFLFHGLNKNREIALRSENIIKKWQAMCFEPGFILNSDNLMMNQFLKKWNTYLAYIILIPMTFVVFFYIRYFFVNSQLRLSTAYFVNETQSREERMVLIRNLATTFFISLLCLVVYILSESWIKVLDEYASLHEIFKIQCGDGDGKLDKYCFDFTLTRDANLITIVIFPMVFYAGWAGVFSYLINPLIEYRVLQENRIRLKMYNLGSVDYSRVSDGMYALYAAPGKTPIALTNFCTIECGRNKDGKNATQSAGSTCGTNPLSKSVNPCQPTINTLVAKCEKIASYKQKEAYKAVAAVVQENGADKTIKVKPNYRRTRMDFTKRYGKTNNAHEVDLECTSADTPVPKKLSARNAKSLPTPNQLFNKDQTTEQTHSNSINQSNAARKPANCDVTLQRPLAQLIQATPVYMGPLDPYASALQAKPTMPTVSHRAKP